MSNEIITANSYTMQPNYISKGGTVVSNKKLNSGFTDSFVKQNTDKPKKKHSKAACWLVTGGFVVLSAVLVIKSKRLAAICDALTKGKKEAFKQADKLTKTLQNPRYINPKNVAIKNGYFVDATSGQRLTGRILGNSTLDTVDILRVKDGIPQRKYLYKWNSEKSGYRKVGSPVDIIYNADDVNKTVKNFRNLKQKNPSSLDNRTNIVTKQVGEVLNKVKNYVKSEEGQFDIITDILSVLIG